MARSLNPIPFRTRPLNSSAPMVLCLKTRESRSLPGLQSTENLRKILSTMKHKQKPRRAPKAGGVFAFRQPGKPHRTPAQTQNRNSRPRDNALRRTWLRLHAGVKTRRRRNARSPKPARPPARRPDPAKTDKVQRQKTAPATTIALPQQDKDSRLTAAKRSSRS